MLVQRIAARYAKSPKPAPNVNLPFKVRKMTNKLNIKYKINENCKTNIFISLY